MTEHTNMTPAQNNLEPFINSNTYSQMENILKAMTGRMVRGVITDECDEIRFQFSDADVIFYHQQDCCESVEIDDINGDFADLVGDILLVAEERTSNEPEGNDEAYDSDTWTFYTFRSLKGSVDVKWHGYSNGYYSESVDIRVEEPTFQQGETA